MSLARVVPNSALIAFECVLYVQAAMGAIVTGFLILAARGQALERQRTKRGRLSADGMMEGLYSGMAVGQLVSVAFSILLAQLSRRVRLRTSE